MKSSLLMILLGVGLPASVGAQAVPQPSGNAQPISTRQPYSDWLAIAKGPIPGFAGALTTFTLGPDRSIFNCVMNVMLTDTATQSAAAREYFARPDAHQGMAPPECGRVTNIKIREVKYRIEQLLDWYTAIEAANQSYVASRPERQPGQFVSKRIDARQNQIQIASPNPEVIARFRRFADSVGVPHAAIDFSDEDIRGVLSGLGLIRPAPSDPSTTYFEFQVDKPASLREGELDRLRRIEKERVGVAGDISFQFVVEGTGRVDATTIKILRTTSDELSGFLRETVGGLDFAPAMKGNTSVRQLVQMSIHF